MTATPWPTSPGDVPGVSPRTAGLSDLAVSPFGLPLALLRDEVSVAFVGRTSTEDNQDPRQSLMRQLERCKTALPPSWVIVTHFYDVESGRMDLQHRGRKTDYERFGIPIARDGGIIDLLAEARQPKRRFDVVICESASRVARRLFENLSVERELETAGVPLFAWNEPIKLDGGRAQQVLQRRINQSVAEYEVLNTLEQSWGGTCAHVREGWNIGKPPYGYRAKQFRHPNPSKAAHGSIKSRLEPDGRRAETVTQIALWRYEERLGYGTIADRLNEDLERYPPPEAPAPWRTRGAWSKSTVAGILQNPKYTGYQVYNRRAMRSRHGQYNDPRLWVWSAQPVHEPLIPKWMFDELTATRKARQGSREGNELSSHPAAKRTYLLRGMVICGCGRRMRAVPHPKNAVYYQCWPAGNNKGRPDKYVGHPKTVNIREEPLVAAIAEFYRERVFGQHRRALLINHASAAQAQRARAETKKGSRRDHEIAQLERQQQNLLRQASEAGSDDSFTQALRATYLELDAQRRKLVEAAGKPPSNSIPTVDDTVLDRLPFLSLNLQDAPEELQRRLYEATQLTVKVDPRHRTAIISITLEEPTASHVANVAAAIDEPGRERGQVSIPLVPPVGLEPTL